MNMNFDLTNATIQNVKSNQSQLSLNMFVN